MQACIPPQFTYELIILQKPNGEMRAGEAAETAGDGDEQPLPSRARSSRAHLKRMMQRKKKGQFRRLDGTAGDEEEQQTTSDAQQSAQLGRARKQKGRGGRGLPALSELELQQSGALGEPEDVQRIDEMLLMEESVPSLASAPSELASNATAQRPGELAG